MPISVKQIIEASGLNNKFSRTVKWGKQIESSSRGIFIISTSEDPNVLSPVYESAPIDLNLIEFWIKKAPKMQIDKQSATAEALYKRLESFWLPDETILYIGQNTTNIGFRVIVNRIYNTELGSKMPTTSAYWLKSLSILHQLHVHYISCSHPEDKRDEMLKIFNAQISKKTKKNSKHIDFLNPFANKIVGRGSTKEIGILNYYD